ncbi:kinase superfamily with octicosapeptide/Phox/Bem1p domain-containing protein [Actinidia rufa]|uniref:Kinase superfamily with octicosapeptide/Phox/Bem1p domain-containing protein n=1 Tax=Actinidia rufa TaxID=165716 RepID=A0A7J0HAM7_9ERIC|nr:kinase superfamily with octicosapeptide/Phox/Bem1p domain-containing protein [Actinidia rufa]
MQLNKEAAVHLVGGCIRNQLFGHFISKRWRLGREEIPAVPGLPKKQEKRVDFNKNQNCQPGYEEITRILGLKRMDSECGSDITEFASAKGSTQEFENGTYASQAHMDTTRKNSDRGHGPRRFTREPNHDPAAVRPSAPSIREIESSQFTQPYGLGVSDGSQSGKMKFLCSFGGKILPRPSDGKLRYVGGDTRIISIQNNLSWEELVKKTSETCKQPHTIKYQLPGEDLDALISVSSDEDLQNMIEEYQGIEKLGGSQRLRIFLIPLDDPGPQRNSEQVLASASSRLKSNLETDSLVDSNPTQYVRESQNLVKSPVQSVPFSLVPGPQGDSQNGHPQLCNNLFSDSIESSSSFITAQFPPLNSSNDAASFYYPIHGAEFHNHSPIEELLVPPSSDRNNINVDEYSCEKLIFKERTFHSEKPISHFEDPTGLLSESNDSIGSQRGMPHAFSDSKLQEHGGRSAYCSQEGISPSSSLNFSKPQLSPLVVSAALQEKPLQLTENIDLVNPQVQIKLLNVDPIVSLIKKMDLQNCSFGSESSSRNENTREDADDNDDKFRSTKNVKSDNFMLQDHSEENNQSCEMLNGFDGKDPFLHWDGDLSKSIPPASSMVYMNKSPSISCDPVCIPSINIPSQELQVFGGMVTASSGIDLNPFADKVMEQTQSIQQEKSALELMFNGQRTAKDQLHVPAVVTGGEHGSNMPWAGNLEVTGMFPASKQCRNENSLTDLLCGLTDGIVSHGIPQPLPSACQDNMGPHKPILVGTSDLCPSAVCGSTGVNANLHIPPAKQNPSQKSGFRREASLIDDDLVNYPNQMVAKPGIMGCPNDKRILEDISPSMYNEQNQLNPMVTAQKVTDRLFPGMDTSSSTIPHLEDATGGEILSPDAMERKSVDFDSENDKSDDGDNCESITDAVIAEIEAGIYGLQIIKNADLEELKELGSGTYGTVYHGKWRGTDVAIKRIKNSCFAGRSSEQERLTKDFWREAHILSTLHHPNVVAFYGVVPDGAGGTLATVAEFMANGSLRNVLLKKDRSLDRRRKLIVAMDAAFGMEYLHSKNIVHFDLKCDNLLVNLRDPQRPICKVGDFGLSRIKRNTLVSGGVRGTLPWMAPELLNGSSNGSNSRVSEKVDVFSFGITMWEILTGEEPYANMHCGAIIGGILKDTLRPLIPERCDPEWRKLMEQCWSTDPKARPSFTDITNRLRSMSAAVQAKGPNNLSKQTRPGIFV